MHVYATNSKERTTVPLYIAVLSVFAAWSLFTAPEPVRDAIPWWVDAPSVMGFFLLFYNLFDRWVWKWKLLHRLGIVRVPNLNGTWHGEVSSSYDEHKTKKEATLDIAQTWLHMEIALRTETSSSQSLMASLTVNDLGGAALDYVYLNEPRPAAIESMQMHRGTAVLNFNRSGGKDTLDGQYYTGRGRQRFGSLCFERVSADAAGPKG